MRYGEYYVFELHDSNVQARPGYKERKQFSGKSHQLSSRKTLIKSSKNHELKIDFCTSLVISKFSSVEGETLKFGLMDKLKHMKSRNELTKGGEPKYMKKSLQCIESVIYLNRLAM